MCICICIYTYNMLVAVIYQSPHISFIKGTDFVEKLMGDLNVNLFSTIDDAKFVRTLDWLIFKNCVSWRDTGWRKRRSCG